MTAAGTRVGTIEGSRLAAELSTVASLRPRRTAAVRGGAILEWGCTQGIEAAAAEAAAAETRLWEERCATLMDASTELEQLYLSVRLAQFAASACSGSGWRALFSSAVSRGHASPLVFVPRPRRRRRGSARRTKSALQPSKDRRSRKLAWRSSRASAQVCRSRCFRYFIASGHFGLGLPTNCRDGLRRVLLHPGRSNCAIADDRSYLMGIRS